MSVVNCAVNSECVPSRLRGSDRALAAMLTLDDTCAVVLAKSIERSMQWLPVQQHERQYVCMYACMYGMYVCVYVRT